MNKREYLRSLGVEVGERGRFSAEMLEALKSFKGDDTPITRTQKIMEEVRQRTYKPQIKQRDDRVYMLELEDGLKIAMAMCSKCKESCIWCMCDGGPQPPTYFDSPIKAWYPDRPKEGALC